MPERFHGTVSFYRNAQGWGYIERADQRQRVFVHFNAIVSDAKYKSLKAGDAVTFEVVQGPKGPMAENVHVVAKEA